MGRGIRKVWENVPSAKCVIASATHPLSSLPLDAAWTEFAPSQILYQLNPKTFPQPKNIVISLKLRFFKFHSIPDALTIPNFIFLSPCFTTSPYALIGFLQKLSLQFSNTFLVSL